MEEPDANGHRHRTVHLREDRHEHFCHKINVVGCYCVCFFVC